MTVGLTAMLSFDGNWCIKCDKGIMKKRERNELLLKLGPKMTRITLI